MKKFFALSRTTHGVLDLAAPGFCALLWLGKFPDYQTILLALFTAFAGYTSIYALNDLMGYELDKEKLKNSANNAGYSVEAFQFRHPLAQHVLSLQAGFAWMLGWFVLAMVGAYVLNPGIMFILAAAAVCEIIYCVLLKVSYLRVFFSGLVKAAGPIAAVFVVDSSPAIYPLLLILAWLMLWEIGGQNIPADWNDVVEDQQVNAKTIPTSFGSSVSKKIVLAAILLTVIASCFLAYVSPLNLGISYLVCNLVIGYLMLIRPAYRLFSSADSLNPASLFNSASYYPLAMLSLITVYILLPKVL